MPAVSLLSLVYYDSKSIIKNMLLLHCSVIYIILVELMFYSSGAWGQTDGGLEVPGDDSSVGVDVSALSTQLYMYLVIIFKSNNNFVICILLLLLLMFYKCKKNVMYSTNKKMSR